MCNVGGGEEDRASGLESWQLKKCEHTQGWGAFVLAWMQES